MKLEFSRQILEKNPKISNFLKICPVGAEFHAEEETNERTDGRTDRTKQVFAFRNFANAPKELLMLKEATDRTC
jgi:hypothetical protein